jgi:hypothetical protein
VTQTGPNTQTGPKTQTGTDTETGTLVTGRPDLRLDDGDHERFAHYVDKSKVTEAMVLGTPVIALCGKVWVPSRDPKNFPVCPMCKELYEMSPQERMEWYGKNLPQE